MRVERQLVAADPDRLAGHIGGGVGGEEHDQRRALVRHPERVPVADLARERLADCRALDQRCVDRDRRRHLGPGRWDDRVDGDVAPRQFERPRSHHPDDAGLCGRVVGLAEVAELAGRRADGDDPAPSPCSRIRIAAARAQVKVPRRWVLITTSKSSSLIFHSTRSRSTPALVTITSRRPNSATARSTNCCAVPPSPTAAISVTTLPLAAVIRCAVSAADSSSTSLTTMAAPACRQRDRVGAAESPPAAGHDRDFPVDADLAHRRYLKTHSAATAGRSEPLTSIVAVILTWTPPRTSVTSVTSAVPRHCAPTGSGAGKRTRSRP